jgi:hypothetical protein
LKGGGGRRGRKGRWKGRSLGWWCWGLLWCLNLRNSRVITGGGRGKGRE